MNMGIMLCTKKGILIKEDDFLFETYNFQIPTDTYYNVKTISEEDVTENTIAFVGVPFGKGNTMDSKTSDCEPVWAQDDATNL